MHLRNDSIFFLMLDFTILNLFLWKILFTTKVMFKSKFFKMIFRFSFVNIKIKLPILAVKVRASKYRLPIVVDLRCSAGVVLVRIIFVGFGKKCDKHFPNKNHHYITNKFYQIIRNRKVIRILPSDW